MKRWIYSYRLVDGEPERLERTLLESCPLLLERMTGSHVVPEPAGDASFLLPMETKYGPWELAKQIRIKLGVAHRSGDRLVLPIAWQAEPARGMFPRFDGALEWQAMSFAHGQLTLVGSYEVPLGVAGFAIDSSLLRDVAHRAADHLIEGLARELQRGVPARPATGGSRTTGALHVRDVMTPRPFVLDESLPMRTAALILFHADIGGAPVVAANGALVGVLTERDLLAKEAEDRTGWSTTADDEDRRRRAATVGEGCTAPARITAPDARLAAAVREMLDHDVSRLVVVGGGQVVGILTRHDALAALIRGDHELLAEVRRQLDSRGASDVDARVEWGQVFLSGTKQLHSTALVLARAAADIDGVAGVNDDELVWLDDDLARPVQIMPM